jgi:cytidine deaminase
MHEVDDRQLIQQTKDFIKTHYMAKRHHVASAIVTDKATYFGLHLDTSGYDICAEPIAISNALIAKDTQFVKSVAVFWDGNEKNEPKIVPPCGDCRQMLIEYAPNLEAIVSEENGEIKKVSIKDLIPYPYVNYERLENLQN